MFLSIGMIFNGLLQVFSIASVIPFLGVAADPKIIQNNKYLALVYNTLNFQSARDFLLFLGSVLILLIILVNLSNAFFTWLTVRFEWNVNHNLSVKLLKHYMNLDYKTFALRNSAELQKNIQTETIEVTSTVIKPFLNILNRVTPILLTIIFLLFIDPLPAILIGGIFGLIYCLIYVMGKRSLSRIGKRSIEEREAKFKLVNEAFGVFKIAKLLHLEPYFVSRFEEFSKKLADNQIKRISISQIPKYGVEAIAFSVMVGISLVIIGAKADFAKAIPIIGLYGFASYRLLPWMQQLYSSVALIRSGIPHVTHLCHEFQSEIVPPPQITNKTITVKKDSKIDNAVIIISFQNVLFSYPNTKSPAVKNISFKIQKHTTVGFLGETGSGKTTTIDLILGLLSPDEGKILVYGEPLVNEKLEEWQKSIGYVPQEICLADNSIAENIALGIPKEKIDMDQVRKVAALANIDTFIENDLKKSYNTLVGERGIRLSGGQRQRIGIARALYHNPSLLVFDEATSSLDNDTEKSVMEAIGNLSHKKTIIIIAHRLSTLKKCDFVFKLDNGKIVESGTFDEVVQQNLVNAS